MSATTHERHDRMEGGILALLVGDALGVPYEFHGPTEIPASEEIEMDPPAGFRRSHAGTPPGTWSDDGAQALALLASLLERGRLDVDDFAARLLAWFERGEYAVDDRVSTSAARPAMPWRPYGAVSRRTGPERHRSKPMEMVP